MIVATVLPPLLAAGWPPLHRWLNPPSPKVKESSVTTVATALPQTFYPCQFGYDFAEDGTLRVMADLEKTVP